MQLRKIQKHFKDLMLDHPDALQSPDTEFARTFAEGDIPLPERLAVYRNNIVGGLTDNLIATFPLVKKLVGLEFMEGMVRTFILSHPPTGGCLNEYGTGFDNFIRTFEPVKSLPYLPDVAAFEIAMNAAYYAPDQTPLTGETLAAIPADHLENLTLQICDHVKYISSDYPLLAIKKFCEQDDPQGELDLSQGGVKVMVSRPDIEVLILELEDDEFMLLSFFSDGETLGSAVKKTMESYPDFDFQEFLPKHIGLKTFQTPE